MIEGIVGGKPSKEHKSWVLGAELTGIGFGTMAREPVSPVGWSGSSNKPRGGEDSPSQPPTWCGISHPHRCAVKQEKRLSNAAAVVLCTGVRAGGGGEGGKERAAAVGAACATKRWAVENGPWPAIPDSPGYTIHKAVHAVLARKYTSESIATLLLELSSTCPSLFDYIDHRPPRFLLYFFS